MPRPSAATPLVNLCLGELGGHDVEEGLMNVNDFIGCGICYLMAVKAFDELIRVVVKLVWQGFKITNLPKTLREYDRCMSHSTMIWRAIQRLVGRLEHPASPQVHWKVLRVNCWASDPKLR